MKKRYFQTIILAILFGLFPSGVLAATVFLESSRDDVSVGDTIVLSLKINTDKTAINTAQGSIAIKNSGGDLHAQELSLADSSFQLWPKTPSLADNGQSISFVGGAPGGFDRQGAVLFKIIFLAKKAGEAVVFPKDITVLANDGKGTMLPVETKGLTVRINSRKMGTVASDDWQSVVSADTIPPESFTIVPGQDPSIFAGQRFVFFSAVDKQSGISRYEVSENGAPAVPSNGTYILRDQKKEVVLTVTAFDKAGNKRVETYSSTPSFFSDHWLSVIIVLVIAIVLIWRVKRRKK